MVIYSGRPYSVSPITLDHDWLLQSFKKVDLNILKEMGTAIGSAISAASTRLDSRDAKSKIIVLITDGASNSGKISPIEAAENAKKLGIKIYTVAIGTEEGRVEHISSIRATGIRPSDLAENRCPHRRGTLLGAKRRRAGRNLQNDQRPRKSETISRTVIEDGELFTWFIGAAVPAALAAAFVLALNPPPAP